MKIAFLGSSEFSKIVLEKLCVSKHNVVCAVTNLDKETGRGHKVVFSPTKVFALQQNIPVLQYARVSRDGFDEIKSFNPDVLVTASFGQLLKENILNLAPFGVVNVHSSLLPKYRGSCPINWAIMNGETTTGVTIMKTNIGLDTGDMILKKEVDILPTETAGELTIRLAKIGADLLIEALDKIEKNEATFTPQDESKASYYPMLDKEMGKIDFNLQTSQIVNKCRGLNPWPLCYVEYNNTNLEENNSAIKVFEAEKFEVDESQKQEFEVYRIGQVVLANSKKGLVVKSQNGFVRLKKIQAPNSKPMEDKAYLNGKKIEVGTQF